MTPKPRLEIDFVSDIACPWCAVGLAAFERAAASLAEDIDLVVRLQPFELNPQMPPEGEDVDEHLVRKYGGPREKFAATREQLRERGAAVGFAFGVGAQGRTRVWNTFDAHRLLHWAGLASPAAQLALKRALLVAYHGEGRNCSDRAVLLDVVARAGLDAAEAGEVLASARYAAEVRDAEAEWQQAGIRAVPSVVVNHRHLIQGGQPPEVFADALRRLAAEAAGPA